MTQKNQVYKCNKCENVVEVKRAGAGELVCCGESMQLLNEEESAAFLTPASMKPGSP